MCEVEARKEVIVPITSGATRFCKVITSGVVATARLPGTTIKDRELFRII